MNEDHAGIVMVTVATFPEAIEAHIVRNRLETEGIPSVIADEHIISNQPWHSIAYGGVKLRVRQQDQERAEAIIREIRTGVVMSVESLDLCPACGSAEIQVRASRSVWQQTLAALFWGKALSNQSRALCLTCGHQWLPG